MSFFKSVLHLKHQPVKSYTEFWNWFLKKEQKFYKVVKERGNIDKVFFSRLAPKLNELKEGIWFLTGMCDEDTVELVLTADGVIKNIVFVEELVQSAPKIKNWKITALKQPVGSNQFGIEIGGYTFDDTTMSFVSNIHESMPDEIDITITHKDFNEEHRTVITNGVYLALDNSLGELNSITAIDNINIINPAETKEELIPLRKLKDFLIWRQKEFIEKYDGFRHDTQKANYSSFEATTNKGLPLLAIINTDLLSWENKPSHPWISVINIEYDGQNNNGMPNTTTYELLNAIEDKIVLDLKDSDGYLNIGRQTVDSTRTIYFACIEFRKPSKILHDIKTYYKDRINIEFDIYKDKYWQSFDRFMAK